MEGLGTLLRKLVEALDGGVQQHYDAVGTKFRPRFYPVANALLGQELLTIRELASSSGLTHSALSQTVKEMKAAGLVESRTGEDARERLIRLTPTGSEACAVLKPIWDAVHVAAAELDSELPSPIRELVGQALLTLSKRDFASRIHDAVKKDRP
jgi:DNA-binding MarR family transcriptional regulator